ncbi:hypothetical protein ACJMK2_015598 [Sinanodonta woodiana]|uniref:G-protein coupled receptors family 1 profile domain-containing protein n=1 Tax=Sinanodonta woodiana TaxID=1069815 RepID=A0ABD3UTT8_SINWO
MDAQTLHLICEQFNTFNISDICNQTVSAAGFDEEFYEKALLNYYLMGIGGTAVSCLGIICNILSVIVLSQRVMNSSTYSYLSSLAVCDTLVLALTMLILLKDTQHPQKGSMLWPEPYYAYMFPIIHPAAITLQVTSVWLTLAFTVDRYIMICHPFNAEKMCNVSRARKVILGIYIMGIIINIPRYLEYKTVTDEIPASDGSGLKSYILYRLTDIGANKLFREIVHSWLYLICVCGIPFFTLAVLNSFLMHAVHMSRKRGKQINAREKRRNDTTVMLIGVVVIFLICQGPALISRMIWAFNMTAASKWPFHVMNEVGNFLIIINSAMNILPYYFFGKKFRKEFWRLFCVCFFNKDELRRLSRNLSFSIDNHRRVSVGSNVTAAEINGFHCPGEQYNGCYKDSFATPLIQISKDQRDYILPTPVENKSNKDADNPSPPALSQVPELDLQRNTSQCSLRVSWKMDNNKNQKYNLSTEVDNFEDLKNM